MFIWTLKFVMLTMVGETVRVMFAAIDKRVGGLCLLCSMLLLLAHLQRLGSSYLWSC